MDSLTGFDDDEDFFGSYDAEQASASRAAHELESAEPAAPSPEQVAHGARFRKPVALFLGAMALLSLTALALRGSEPIMPAPIAQRELVAHYGAAVPAATPVFAAKAVAPAPFEPWVWASVCPAPSKCLRDSRAVAAWLSVRSSQSANGEDGASHLTHSSNGRVRRPLHTSSIGLHVSPGTRVAPVAAPKPAAAKPAGVTSVARFPED